MAFNSLSFRSRNKRIRLPIILGILGIFLCHGIYALQLNMVASRVPFGRTPLSGQKQAQRVQPASTNTVTSSLISQLAVAALKLRLKTQTHVSCDVAASSSNLFLRGEVGPVTVKGRGWGSRLGLTCRVIEATVDKCELDMGRVIANQKLVLTVPAEGNAMVALDEKDFGNFITHPLMRPPGLPNTGETDSKLEFVKDNVSIDASSGTVNFYGQYMDMMWRFTLQRGSKEGQKALITVTPQSKESDLDLSSMALQLTEVTSNFFNEMVFDLDGTFLSFKDMMLTKAKKEPIVMLSLGILVRKFPSPGLDF